MERVEEEETWALEVIGGSEEKLGRLPKSTEPAIALKAEKSAHEKCEMIVVDGEVLEPPRCGRFVRSTNGAAPVLFCKFRVVVFEANTVDSSEVMAAVDERAAAACLLSGASQTDARVHEDTFELVASSAATKYATGPRLVGGQFRILARTFSALAVTWAEVRYQLHTLTARAPLLFAARASGFRAGCYVVSGFAAVAASRRSTFVRHASARFALVSEQDELENFSPSLGWARALADPANVLVALRGALDDGPTSERTVFQIARRIRGAGLGKVPRLSASVAVKDPRQSDLESITATCRAASPESLV